MGMSHRLQSLINAVVSIKWSSSRIVQLGNYPEEVLGNECGVVSEFVDSFQPTTPAHKNLRLIMTSA